MDQGPYKVHTGTYRSLRMPIDFLHSQYFLHILERKFNLKNLLPDWKLFGGGLHESFRGGFLKIHSDFIHMRKSKLKRRLNLLLFLNSNWNENWGGAIELWDKKMTSAKKIILPKKKKEGRYPMRKTKLGVSGQYVEENRMPRTIIPFLPVFLSLYLTKGGHFAPKLLGLAKIPHVRSAGLPNKYTVACRYSFGPL